MSISIEPRRPVRATALFVTRHARGDGFHANIRGHVLELADPSSGHELAPTPDDLQVASIASELAWSAQRFLRTCGLPDQVSVSAEWRAHDDPPGQADISLTVTISTAAEAVSGALAVALEQSLAARSHAESVVRISLDGLPR